MGSSLSLVLQGKVVVITGSTAGIGKAGAIGFAREGAKVVVSGRDRKRGGEVVDAIKKQGGEASFIPADMLSVADIESLIKQAVATTAGWTSSGTTLVLSAPIT